jgi:hypothetical protein
VKCVLCGVVLWQVAEWHAVSDDLQCVSMAPHRLCGIRDHRPLCLHLLLQCGPARGGEFVLHSHMNGWMDVAWGAPPTVWFARLSVNWGGAVSVCSLRR